MLHHVDLVGNRLILMPQSDSDKEFLHFLYDNFQIGVASFSGREGCSRLCINLPKRREQQKEEPVSKLDLSKPLRYKGRGYSDRKYYATELPKSGRILVEYQIDGKWYNASYSPEHVEKHWEQFPEEHELNCWIDIQEMGKRLVYQEDAIPNASWGKHIARLPINIKYKEGDGVK